MSPISAVLRAVASAEALSMRKLSLPSIAAKIMAPTTPSAADFGRGREPAIDRAEHDEDQDRGRHEVDEAAQLRGQRQPRQRCGRSARAEPALARITSMNSAITRMLGPTAAR